MAVSVPLVLEYEDALSRLVGDGIMSGSDIGIVIDFLCSVAHKQKVFYLWRPFLRGPGDDMVLELAVEATCTYIVTHNIKDFSGCDMFGVQGVRPGRFLRLLGRDP